MTSRWVRSSATWTTDGSDIVGRTTSGAVDPNRSREWSDGTFALSNLGMFTVSQFTAIIVPPQVAILATGRTAPRPVVRDGQVVIRSMLTATLSADHRAIDGAATARFLKSLKHRIEVAM